MAPKGDWTMAVYYGTVKGRTIILRDDVRLSEGTEVEIRPLDSERAPTFEEEDLRVQRALLAAGLLREILPLGAQADEFDPPPIEVGGTPLSEMIIAERR